MNWAYIAGFIDGEGYISFNLGRARVRIGIENTNKQVLEEIQKFINAGFISQRNRINEPNRIHSTKLIYILQINKLDDILRICEETVNYSIVKKELIEKAIGVIKLFLTDSRYHNLKFILTKEKLEKLHFKDKLSVKEIANSFGKSYWGIW